MNYLVVGDGQLARHLKNYFRLLNLQHSSWQRNQSHLAEAVNKADCVLLAISDSAIANFYHEHDVLSHKTCVHFSGALNFPEIYGAHPLMTFTNELMSLEKYKEIAFITVKEHAPFASIFPDLPNPSYQISTDQKAMYHSLCVVSGNFTNILWRHCLNQFSQMGLPEEAIKPYAKQCFANILKYPEDTLTGPISRGDSSTIRSNINSLKSTELDGLYDKFIKLHQLNEAQS